MKTITIKSDFKEDYITRPAGEKLRHMILSASEPLVIDFKGVTIGSTSFFDEAFAKLVLEGWDIGRFKKEVKIKDMNPFDQKVFKQVCEYRGLII